MNDVNWIPALSVLAAGLVIGALVLWRVVLHGAPAARARAAPGPSIERRDLDAKRDALIGQLRELDGAASKRTPEQLAHERHALEHEAARVLREIDRLRPATAGKEQKKKKAAPESPAGVALAEPVEEEAEPTPTPPSALKGFLWGVGSVGALGLLFFLVSQSAKERAPGGSATGNTPMAGGPAGRGPAAGETPANDVELTQARAAVERSPDDVELRLDLVRLLLMRQDLMAVFDETQAVLQRSPGNSRALSYQALVRLAMGQAGTAESMLKEVMKREPKLLDAYLHLMLVYVRTGREPEAEKVLAQAAKLFPERADSLRGLLDQMRTGSGGQPQTAGAAGEAEDPHADIPGGGAAPAGPPAGMPRADAGAAPATGPEKKVAGVLELDPSVRGQSFSGGIVFVTLRDGSFGAGPPLAAKRLPMSSFPMPFEIGSADSMSGEPLPDDLLIEARIDQDGNPMTRAPTDPYGRERVPAGSKGVKVVLKPKAQ